jgi:RNA polymerase sigma factor for flagellar operon FliA
MEPEVLGRRPLRPDERLGAAETVQRRGEMIRALGRALDHLDPKDRLIIQMRFAEGSTVADMSRALQLEQKPLYRRMERLLRQLRTYLESDGVQPAEVREILEVGELL